MDKLHKEKYYAGMKMMNAIGDDAKEYRDSLSYKNKHTRKEREQEYTDYGISREERYHGGESYYKIAGIKCSFGD